MGATFSLPEKDRYGYGRRYLDATMRVLCGGRIAESKKTGDVSSGAAMDIQMVTAYGRHMVLEWGMSERLGFVNYSGVDSREMYIPDKDYSDETAKVIDDEIRRISDEAYRDATEMIEANWEKVVAVAEALLRYETLSGDEVDRLMKGDRLDKPTVAELLRDATTPTPTPTRPKRDDRADEEPSGGMMPSPA
jgi:cell division protease FtsH